MDDRTTQFLPFHAINEFMRDDYRLEVIRSVLGALKTLPPDQRETIDRLTRRHIQIPGFRNSAKAPAGLRVKPTAEAFEKQPQLVAAILSAWSGLHTELRQQVYDLLTSRQWGVMPPEADRSQLPGFITAWPKGENFEGINQAYKESYPSADEETDDISLMVVWLSGRLPYPQQEQEGTEASEGHPEQV